MSTKWPRFKGCINRAIFLTLVISLFLPIFLTGTAAADYPRVLSRSLTIGTSEPGVSTDYEFSWRWPTNASVGSIRLRFCYDTEVDMPCSSTPPGDMSGAVLASQSGTLGGFSVSNQTASELILSRASAGNTGTGQYRFVFNNVINPTVASHRFFVQIFTYSSTDGTGTAHHMASVANAITEPIMINTEVPPILYFCAGLSISEWCEDVNGNFITYGNLDATNGHWATSQFGVATNAVGGYVVTVNGNTMTSGNKVIDALSAPGGFTTGVRQFGINLRANTLPAVGQDAFGTGVGTVELSYDTPDQFQFNSGDVVAGAVTGSMFNTFTVTYIVNIDPDLPSGVYNTTIAYVCTAAF